MKKGINDGRPRVDKVVRYCVMGLLGLMLAPLPSQAKTRNLFLPGRKVLLFRRMEGHALSADLLVPGCVGRGEVTVSASTSTPTVNAWRPSIHHKIWTMGSITGEQNVVSSGCT